MPIVHFESQEIPIVDRVPHKLGTTFVGLGDVALNGGEQVMEMQVDNIHSKIKANLDVFMVQIIQVIW